MYDRRNDGESTGGTQPAGRIVRIVEEKKWLEMCPMAPMDFDRSVNPISTRGTDYAHLIFRPSDGPDTMVI